MPAPRPRYHRQRRSHRQRAPPRLPPRHLRPPTQPPPRRPLRLVPLRSCCPHLQAFVLSAVACPTRSRVAATATPPSPTDAVGPNHHHHHVLPCLVANLRCRGRLQTLSAAGAVPVAEGLRPRVSVRAHWLPRGCRDDCLRRTHLAEHPRQVTLQPGRRGCCQRAACAGRGAPSVTPWLTSSAEGDGRGGVAVEAALAVAVSHAARRARPHGGSDGVAPIASCTPRNTPTQQRCSYKIAQIERRVSTTFKYPTAQSTARAEFRPTACMRSHNLDDQREPLDRHSRPRR